MPRPPRSPRASATRTQCFFYISPEERDGVVRVLGGVPFTEYVASAVLERAQRDGSIFYGRVRGGTCDRASPYRERPCTSGLPASWWNRYGLSWVCPTCAAAINAMEAGICTPPAQDPKVSDGPVAISFCPLCGVKAPRVGTHAVINGEVCPWADVDGAFDRVQVDGIFRSAGRSGDEP